MLAHLSFSLTPLLAVQGPTRQIPALPDPGEFASLPDQDLVLQVSAHHREAARWATIDSRSQRPGYFRRDREAAAERAAFHCRVLQLLRLPPDELPITSKRLILMALYGDELRLRKHTETLIRKSDLKKVTARKALIAQIEQAIRHGLPHPFPIPRPEDLTPAASTAMTALREELRSGHTVLAVLPLVELLSASTKPLEVQVSLAATELFETETERTLASGDPTWAAKIAPLWAKTDHRDFALAITYDMELARVLELCQRLQADLSQLELRIHQLRAALAREPFPATLFCSHEQLSRWSGAEAADTATKAFPYGQVAIEQSELETYCSVYAATAADPMLQHVTAQIPVVIALPTAATDGGCFAIGRLATCDLYCRPEDLTRVQAHCAQLMPHTTIRFYPFLPPPMALLSDCSPPLQKALRLAVQSAAIDSHAIMAIAARSSVPEITFPADFVAHTNATLAEPNTTLNRTGKQLRAASRGIADPSARDFVEGAADLIADQALPLEARLAISDMLCMEQAHFFVSLRLLVQEYWDNRAELSSPTARTRLAHLILERYCHFVPWALGLFTTRPPLPLNDRWLKTELNLNEEEARAARHFYYRATRFALLDPIQVRQFLTTLARMPQREGSDYRMRLLTRLATLHPFEDEEAMAFVASFTGPFYDEALRHFCSEFPLSTGHDPKQQFRELALAGRHIFLPETELAIATLVETASGPEAPAGTEWRIQEAAQILAVHLFSVADKETALALLKQLAQCLKAWQRIHPLRDDEDDPLVRDLLTLRTPHHFMAMLRLLGRAITRSPHREEYLSFLNRQQGNLNALQYFFLGLWTRQQLHSPEAWLLGCLQQEQLWQQRINPRGRISGDPFFKHALLEGLGFHYHPNRFSLEEERRVLAEWEERDEVRQVEVMAERWGAAVPDLRIHFRDGRRGLIEIKTVQGDDLDEATLTERIAKQVMAAAHQLDVQGRRTGEHGNEIIVTIHRSKEQALTEAGLEHLEGGARLLIANHSHIAHLTLRQHT